MPDRPVSDCPYKNLVIFHVDGIFDNKYEDKLGRNYLGNWVEDKYSFLFFTEEPESDIEKIIMLQPDLSLLDKYNFTYEEWQGGGFERRCIDDFFIVPPWDSADRVEGRYKIVLDPGVVFGNGLHPTTRDCLLALSHLKKKYDFKKVLDIGTGTGILAIASLLLGAEFSEAVDLNPLAVKTARNNVCLNGFERHIKVYEGRAEDFTAGDADLVIANIHFEVIKALLQEKSFIRREFLIFSGLMRSQARDLKKILSDKKMHIEKEWDHDMTWYTLLVSRKEE